MYVCEAIERIMSADQNRKAAHHIFNIGNCHSVNITRVIELIEMNVGKKALLHYDDSAVGEMLDTLADSSKLYEYLHWQPTTKIEDGIAFHCSLVSKAE
jgi:UDP-glucuronate 4-epimerase